MIAPFSVEQIPTLYQDDDYLFVHKPAKLLVHPYHESTDIFHLLGILEDALDRKLYPIHRLDRPVSGIVGFGLHSKAVAEIKKSWHSDQVVKQYQALVKGHILEAGTFSFDLSDEDKVKRKSITHYRPLQSFNDEYSLVEVTIETGRKHQIRRHFARRCHVIVGDRAHGQGKVNRYFKEHFALDRIFLHAHNFEFIQPFTMKQVQISCPLPPELSGVLCSLADTV
jgi:tRNA pseudouridine65 synthase